MDVNFKMVRLKYKIYIGVIFMLDIYYKLGSGGVVIFFFLDLVILVVLFIRL